MIKKSVQSLYINVCKYKYEFEFEFEFQYEYNKLLIPYSFKITFPKSTIYFKLDKCCLSPEVRT